MGCVVVGAVSEGGEEIHEKGGLNASGFCGRLVRMGVAGVAWGGARRSGGCVVWVGESMREAESEGGGLRSLFPPQKRGYDVVGKGQRE